MTSTSSLSIWPLLTCASESSASCLLCTSTSRSTGSLDGFVFSAFHNNNNNNNGLNIDVTASGLGLIIIQWQEVDVYLRFMCQSKVNTQSQATCITVFRCKWMFAFVTGRKRLLSSASKIAIYYYTV